MFAAEITTASVQQIYEFRAMVDAKAAGLAAQRATPAQIDELRGLHQALVAATDAVDIDRYVDSDRQFYKVLGEAAHNVWLADSLPRIFNLHLRLWFFISRRIGSWESIAHAHEVMTRDVVAAISWRDVSKAQQAMETYVAGRLEDIRSIL